ncbi:IS3 family transposase [Halobacillus shinanisalinarum]|uniref:IS3 family transposase n=1 Tax=Halobacillus shinanisalinarum TaxID=2932258 RepID=UPI0037C0EEC1
MIEQTLREKGLKHLIQYFCKIAGVSRSGYYNWLKAEDTRQRKEQKDEADYKVIKKVYDNHQGKVGALQIKMFLEHDESITMNHKRIRRLMKKYNLKCKIRVANPYKQIAKATQEHKTCENKLERHFNQGEPHKVLLTDITYVYYAEGRKAYLSVIKDGATREALAYHLSTSLKMDLVYQTIDKLMEREDFIPHPECLIHSDQGVHYTHPDFQKKIKALGMNQSDVSSWKLLGQRSDGILFWTYEGWHGL